MYIPYKERILDTSKPVKVYRCLNKKGKIYSIKQGGYVIGHTEEIKLVDVEFIIIKSGKKLALETRRRNVHAFVKGYVTSANINSNVKKVTYYPFNDKGFLTEDGDEINKCNSIEINNRGLYADSLYT